MNGHMKSFHTAVKVMSPRTKAAGRTTGKAMRQNSCQLLHPSILAAA